MASERRTRANGRASRKALLDAAVEVFAQGGYRGTTLTEVAHRAGMTQTGLLHHFRTKNQLLIAVIQEREDTTAAVHGLTQNLAAERFRVVEHLVALANINAATRQDQLLLTTLRAEAAPGDHPLHEHFVQRYRRFRRGLASILADAQAGGAIRADLDVSTLAREVVATLDGLHLQWLLDPEGISLERAVRAYAERLSKEIAPGLVEAERTM